MDVATTLLSRRVRDCMAPPPPLLAPDASCSDVIDVMAASGVSCAIVRAAGGGCAGIVTEQDVARRVALRMAAEAPAWDAMSSPVRTVRPDDYLYTAVAAMRRHGLRHLPAVDATGSPVGMLDLDAALAEATAPTVAIIDRLTLGEDAGGLAEMKRAEAEIAGAMIADGAVCADIQALISHVNAEIHRRVAAAALRAMERDGLGRPPVAFAAIVMGSGGRGESYLFPDQDNGFIIADYPDSEHDRIDGFFLGLADRMTAALDAAGFPLCSGGVMATNPLWRKTLTQWREQTAIWARRRSPAAVRLADIFFDFQAVCGDDALAAMLRRHVTGLMRGNIAFLQEVMRDQARYGTALGLFGRLRRDRAPGPYRGQVDLKRGGTLALVNAVRLLALREGIAVTPTHARIAALRGTGVLDADDADEISAAFRLMSMLVLRRQVEQAAAGARPGNHIPPSWLTRRERRGLLDALRVVDRLRDRVAGELSGNVLTGGR
ncbi:MAG: CBS domain-containing protein [Alphaproteobacteria bacterium]|nr:CBS domain-containing protein [Alphaproteobacteria bacterium]